MEAEIFGLRMEKKAAVEKAEKLVAEKKANLEQKIITGLYNSPLLQAVQQEVIFYFDNFRLFKKKTF